MKNIRKVLAFLFIAVAVVSCRKDDVQGAFGIRPHDFLSGSKYDKLTVEIAYVDGYQPTGDAVVRVQNFLNERLNKPGGISIVYNSISSPGRASYTTEDLIRVEKDHRQHHTKGSELTVFVFFADAPSAANSGNQYTLGIAYGTTSMAVFERTVNDNSGGLTQPSRPTLETITMEHEFGHLFGLVNNGTQMLHNHEDNNNAKHCNNSNCLMYFEAESTDILGHITGDRVPDLDNSCIADLRANGGK